MIGLSFHFLKCDDIIRPVSLNKDKKAPGFGAFLYICFLFAYKYRYRVVPYLCEARRQREFIRLFSNAVF